LDKEEEKKDPPEELPAELTPQAILDWIVQNWWLVLIIILLIIILIVIIIRTGRREHAPRYLYYY